MPQIEFSQQEQAFIRQAVESGAFANESELVHEALRLLQIEQKSLPWDDETIMQFARPSIEQAERGEYVEISVDELEQFFDEIEREARGGQAA